MDYFNESERAAQEKFRLFRDKALSNVIEVLKRLNITPNIISYIGVAFLFAVVFVPADLYWLTGVFISLYVLMDGIDGPLARALDKSHEGGSIVDMFSDQLGVIIIPVASIIYLNVNGVSSLLFSTAYILLIVIVIFENELKDYKQVSFIRIKYLVYAAYVVSLYFKTGVLMYWLFSIGAVYYWFSVFARINSIYYFFDEKKKKKP